MTKAQPFNFRNLAELNLVMLLLGTSGPFGKYIDLPASLTIAVRAMVALVLLVAFLKWKGLGLRLKRKDTLPIVLSGILMGVHWVTYFESLQRSSVAIGMLSLFTYPVWTAMLEPFFFKTKFQKMHLLLGGLVLIGIYFLVPSGSVQDTNLGAIAFGVVSAICYAVRNLILKAKVASYQGSVLMMYQLVIVSLLLLPTLFIYDLGAVPGQWKGLLGVAVITTALGHTLFISTFKNFSITTISIISGIQPVYGIILGALFLSEVPRWTTVIGGILILTSVVVESIRAYR